MKKLLLLRHAKSSWDDPILSDHDRPLNNRGLRDAPRMGKLLTKNKLIPDLIISSSAKRAYHTAQLAAEQCQYKELIQTEPQLYGASTDTIIQILSKISTDHQRVLLVGHNPDLELFVQKLTGAHCELPTAALVKITLLIHHWQELNQNTKAALEQIWRPKELK